MISTYILYTHLITLSAYVLLPHITPSLLLFRLAIRRRLFFVTILYIHTGLNARGCFIKKTDLMQNGLTRIGCVQYDRGQPCEGGVKVMGRVIRPGVFEFLRTKIATLQRGSNPAISISPGKPGSGIRPSG